MCVTDVVADVELGRAHAAETAASARLNAARTTFRREALDAFNEADATARLREQEYRIAAERNRRTILASPTDGVVQQVQVTTIGAVLRPAEMRDIHAFPPAHAPQSADTHASIPRRVARKPLRSKHSARLRARLIRPGQKRV